MAQIIKRGESVYLIRIALGTDEAGKRHFHNETVHCSYKKACQRATALEHKRDLGENIEPSSATLARYLKEWLAILKPRISTRTHASYKSLLDTHVIPLIGWKPISRLSALDLETVYSAMEDAKKSRRTIQYTHTVLSAALRQAVMWRLINHNPSLNTDKRTRRRGRQITIRPFTEVELDRFLAAAVEDRYYAVFLVGITSGLRPEEYLALGWQHFDAKAGTLRVERVLIRHGKTWTFHPPKTNTGRRLVPIPQRTIEVLNRLRREQSARRLQTHNLIFTGAKGEPLDEGNLRRRHFRQILTRAKLDQRRLYDLRHTWATLSLAAGADPKAVSEWLGHRSVAFTLDTYQHLIPSVSQKSSKTIELLFSR